MDIPKINRVTLSLPEEILRSQNGARFIQVEEPGCSYPTSNRSHGSFGTYTEFIVSRAKKWMIQSPCAIVTAWRNGDTRAVKDANNRNLQQTLRGKGYGVAKVRGCYAEVGCEASQENSRSRIKSSTSHASTTRTASCTRNPGCLPTPIS